MVTFSDVSLMLSELLIAFMNGRILHLRFCLHVNVAFVKLFVQRNEFNSC